MEGEIKYNIEWAKNQVDPEFLFFYGHRPKPNQITKSCLSQWYYCIIVNFIPMVYIIIVQNNV